MNNIVILHSEDRNRKISNSSPAKYSIDLSQICCNIFKNSLKNEIKPAEMTKSEFVVELKVHSCIIPYINGVTDNLPMIYLNLRSIIYKDTVIFTTKRKAQPSTHPLLFDKIQTNNAGTKTFVHYKSCYNQTMRFSRDRPIDIDILDNNGVTLVISGDTDETVAPIPSLQTTIVFEISSF